MELRMTRRNFCLLTGSILGVQALGILGSLVTFPAIPTWYASLEKPFFSPPNWVFGPVWTTLYVCIGVSLFLALTKTTKKLRPQRRRWVQIFIIQLLLNTLWSFLFFGFQAPLLALIELLALWLTILWLAKEGKKFSPWIPRLLLPYLAWVTFAGLLNGAVWWLNAF